MMKTNECNICKSTNIEKLSVNGITLNSVEKKGANGAADFQDQLYPIAYLCHDCGHVEFFCEE